MTPDSMGGSLRRIRLGFTLIELLVVITIIGVLIGILLPVLGMARQRVWDAVCLANTGQHMQAFHAYVNDFKHVPYANLPDKPDGTTNQYFQINSMAGVDWYTDEIRADGMGHPAKERPLNDYLSMNPHQTLGGEITHCPGDTVIYRADFAFGSNAPDPVPRPVELSPQFYGESSAPDGARSFHGAFGSSYTATDWLWVSPSAPWGVVVSDERQRDLWFTYKNGPEDFEDPSRFVVFSEHGIASVMKVATVRAETGFVSIPYTSHNFRHEKYRSNMAFMDGSARLEDMPLGANNSFITSNYSFAAYPRRSLALDRALPDYNFNGSGFVRFANLPPSVIEEYGLTP